jgi:hypothetical protein
MLPALSVSLPYRSRRRARQRPHQVGGARIRTLGALNVGYHNRAATPGSDVLAVITEAADAALTILDPARHPHRDE